MLVNRLQIMYIWIYLVLWLWLMVEMIWSMWIWCKIFSILLLILFTWDDPCIWRDLNFEHLQSPKGIKFDFCQQFTGSFRLLKLWKKSWRLQEFHMRYTFIQAMHMLLWIGLQRVWRGGKVWAWLMKMKLQWSWPGLASVHGWVASCRLKALWVTYLSYKVFTLT